MRDLQTRLCLGTDEGPTDLPGGGGMTPLGIKTFHPKLDTLFNYVTVTCYSLSDNELTKAGLARLRSMATSQPGLNLPTIY